MLPSLHARLALYAGLTFAALVAVLLLARGNEPAEPCDAACVAVGHATQRARTTSDSLAVARVALVKDQARTLISTTRYVTIRDSIFVPVTRAETVAVLDRLPAFVASTDSLAQSCSALQHSASLYVTRCDSALTAERAVSSACQTRYEASRPSKWAPVKEWAIRIGIGYGAFRLGQGMR